MPTLGIGQSTPYHMGTDHPTALNHCFRDTAPYNPAAQARIKCPFCGVWAKRGENCYLCRRFVKGIPAARDNSVRISVGRRTPTNNSLASGRSVSAGGGGGGSYAAQHEISMNSARGRHVDPSAPRDNRAAAVRRSVSRGRQPEPLPGAEAEAAKPAPKVKCRSCGCWVELAKPCRLCRTVTTKLPSRH
mmetsp:Transcript_12844/g.39906  ORF Transcript_12844/g.39906 Transcript_12844/m.39906 type:complete len:189 (-) Transcript_12844:287-853(-)